MWLLVNVKSVLLAVNAEARYSWLRNLCPTNSDGAIVQIRHEKIEKIRKIRKFGRSPSRSSYSL